MIQLKIFTTAAFAVIMLGRTYSSAKWRALMLLVLGCILVASPTFNRPPECDYDSYLQNYINTSQAVKSHGKDTIAIAKTAIKRYLRARILESADKALASNAAEQTASDADETNGLTLLDSMIGLGAVVVMVTMSGYSSIYFEGMLKQQGAKITIW